MLVGHMTSRTALFLFETGQVVLNPLLRRKVEEREWDDPCPEYIE